METATPPPGQVMEGQAFGAEAERRLATLDRPATAGTRLIVADATRPAEALTAAVDLKMRGERCAVALCLPEPRLMIARLAAASVVTQVAEDDHRRALFDQIAAGTLKDASGKLLSDIPVYADAVIRTLIALVRLADELIAGSWTEYERVSRLLSYRHQRPRIICGQDPAVPTISQRTASEVIPQVVVWGPHRSAKDLTTFAYALADLHVPWRIVCRDPSEANLPGVYVAPSEAGLPFARASVVVDTDLDGPATSLALCARHDGIRLVAEATSGTHEHIQDIATYDGADRRSILEAVRIALAAPSATVVASRTDRLPPVETHSSGPLVTIVIPTRPGRYGYCRQALQSVLNQSHQNLEIIINDLSRPVGTSEPWPSDSRVTMYTHNWMPLAHAVHGKYLGILYDDDLLFPDHVATLAAALDVSGAGIAWSDLLVRYLERMSETELRVVGYGLWNGVHQPFDRVSLLGQCTLGNMVPCLMRRDLFIEIDGFDSSFAMFADWDLFIRFTKKYEFVYVPHVTAQYSRFLDSTNKGTQDWGEAGTDTLKIFQKHPSTDRFTVAERRNAVLQYHMTAVRPPDVPPVPFVSSTLNTGA